MVAGQEGRDQQAERDRRGERRRGPPRRRRPGRGGPATARRGRGGSRGRSSRRSRCRRHGRRATPPAISSTAGARDALGVEAARQRARADVVGEVIAGAAIAVAAAGGEQRLRAGELRLERLEHLRDGDRAEHDRRLAGLGGLRRALVEAGLGGGDERGEVEPGRPERDGLRPPGRETSAAANERCSADVDAARGGDRHARGARAQLDREPDPGGVLERRSASAAGSSSSTAASQPACGRAGAPAAGARGRRPARGRAARARPPRRRRASSPASLRSVVEAAPTRPSASTTSSAVACTRSETPCSPTASRRSHQTVAWPSPSRRATALRASAERSCSVGAIAARSLPVARNPASGRGWASMRCAGSLLHSPWTTSTSRSLRCSGRTPGGRSRASASASA